MRLVMQESAQGLTSEERLMINRVLDLQNITVRQVAIPMANVSTITVETPMSEALKLVQEKRVTRLPVWRLEGDQRRIVGIVSLRTLLYHADLDTSRSAGDYLTPALYMEEDVRLEAALTRMQRSGQRLAIVLGRDQREIGIVSLQDILKVILARCVYSMDALISNLMRLLGVLALVVTNGFLWRRNWHLCGSATRRLRR